MASGRLHHRIVVVGGGTAGVSVAARLRRAGEDDVAVLEPSGVHYYQPLWTLAGGGRAPIEESMKREADVMPRGVRWIQDAATAVDPVEKTVSTRSGTTVGYDFLVVCPGIQLDWDKVGGLPEALGRDRVASNYSYETAPFTWELVRSMRGGTAVFTMPSGPIKCAGAPQKAAYLSAHYWQRKDVLKNIHVVLVLPTPSIFGVPEFAAVLEQVVERYGIDVRYQHEMVEVDASSREVVLVDRSNGNEVKSRLGYDLLHAVPPQSAPDWLKQSPLCDPSKPTGYVEIDKNTLQHVTYPDIFALGDAGSSPNSKTGAAIRKQAPVLVANLRAHMNGRKLDGDYDGYSSCPLTTARNRMLLAEFDYTLKPHPTIPLIDTKKERYDMWLLKRYGLPFMYWNLMLKGLA